MYDIVSTANQIKFSVNVSSNNGLSDCVDFNLKRNRAEKYEAENLDAFISCSLDNLHSDNWTCYADKWNKNNKSLKIRILPKNLFDNNQFNDSNTSSHLNEINPLINGTIQCRMAKTKIRNDQHFFLFHFKPLRLQHVATGTLYPTKATMAAAIPLVSVLSIIVTTVAFGWGCYNRRQLKILLKMWKADDSKYESNKHI